MEHLGFPTETVIILIAAVFGSLIVDFLAHRADKEISFTSACLWSLFWIAVSILFGGYIYFHHGREMASLFFTGYVLEKVLSVDNLFVIMAIFSWFSVPSRFRHRVLYWGVLGAFVFRGIFVAIGTGLLMFGPFVEMIFALVVAYTAVMMLRSGGDEEELDDYSNHIAYRAVRKVFPVWPRLHGHDFFISRHHAKEEAKKLGLSIEGFNHKIAFVATPLFLCLAVIEVSDVMFAFDSVPAVIAVSREPLIIYSAMIFAILGLRSLYFVLESLKKYLVHLEKAVIVLLFFIAAKLMAGALYHQFHIGFDISPTTSLVVVLVILSIGIVASILFPDKSEQQADADSVTTPATSSDLPPVLATSAEGNTQYVSTEVNAETSADDSTPAQDSTHAVEANEGTAPSTPQNKDQS